MLIPLHCALKMLATNLIFNYNAIVKTRYPIQIERKTKWDGVTLFNALTT